MKVADEVELLDLVLAAIRNAASVPEILKILVLTYPLPEGEGKRERVEKIQNRSCCAKRR